jgi:peroxiredoxin
MSESESASSSLRTAWYYVKHYWHWPVLIAVAIYAYQQFLPSIDLREPGYPAPTLVAETLDGDTFRLREHRGEVVVVNVWATWCAPCRVEMPGFVDLQTAFRDRGVQFVGISVDQPGSGVVQSFVEDKGINFPQIVSPGLANRTFPGEVVPRTYVIDKQGRVRYEHSGVILKWALDDALETLVDEPAETTAIRREASEAGGSTGPLRRVDAFGQERWSRSPTPGRPHGDVEEDGQVSNASFAGKDPVSREK